MDEKLYWSIKFVFILLGIVFFFQVAGYLSTQLQSLVYLYSVAEMTHEFQFISICVSIYLTCTIVTSISNLLGKLNRLLEKKHISKQIEKKSLIN